MRNTICFLVLCLYFTEIYPWSIGNLLLTGSQATITNAESVAIGAQKGLNECLRQFSFERWSCPEMTFGDVFKTSRELPANREIAFVQAILSAGIVYTVTRNCSLGQMDGCKCLAKKTKREDTAKTGFLWGGCSDNTDFGSKIAITYLDNRELGQFDSNAKIRLHNYEVGRQAVKETMIKICKCHGVSGSCSLQTCWMRINTFEEVGDYLKRAYRKAVKIDPILERVREKDMMKKSAQHIQKMSLIYAEDSPDYCIANATLGSNGTLGRYCSQRRTRGASKEEKRSCRKLCTQCGHKVRRERRRVITSCNCKFKYCCEVECQSCAKEQYSFVCSRHH